MFDMFKAPHLDTDDGINMGGGVAVAEGQQTVNQQPDTIQEDGKQQAQQEGQQEGQQGITEPPKIKVKYNHQELELPYDEAVQHIQKGMNYEKAVERAKQEAKKQALDEFIAEQGYIWNGKLIKTYDEYKQALYEKQLIDRYKGQGLPEEVIAELVENRKFREQYQAKEKEFMEKERREKDYIDFTEWYTKTYGKEPNPEEIPTEVWQEVEKGKPLKYAFMEYGYSTMNDRIAKLEQQFQTQQANQKNAESSTGSVKTSGKPTTFFTREQVEAMTTEEVYRNYDAIMESKKHWK